MSGTKVLDSKPLKIVFDPDVHFAAGEHERYNAIVTDLHAIQRRGVAMATALNSLYPQMDSGGEERRREERHPRQREDAVRILEQGVRRDPQEVRRADQRRQRADVAAVAAGAVARSDPENVLARASTLKTQLAGVWEAPSAASVHQYNDVKLALPKAVADANAFLGKANAVSQALAKYGVTIKVPATVK